MIPDTPYGANPPTPQLSFSFSPHVLGICSFGSDQFSGFTKFQV